MDGGGKKNMEGDYRRETIIRIYCLKFFIFNKEIKLKKKNISDLIVYGLYTVTKVSGQWSGSLSEDWDLEWKIMVHLFLEMGMCMEPATFPFSQFPLSI